MSITKKAAGELRAGLVTGAEIETAGRDGSGRFVATRGETTPQKRRADDPAARARKALADMTDAEDAEITAAALTDPDALPNVATARQRGRPRSAEKKVPVLLKLDPDLVDSLRASGPGWQTRVNALLRREMLK